MKMIYCYTNRLPAGTQTGLSFLELLLDETWSQNILCFPSDIFQHAGPLNQRLNTRKNYEFLLRAARIYPVTAIGYGCVSSEHSSFPEEALPAPVQEPFLQTPMAFTDSFPDSSVLRTLEEDSLQDMISQLPPEAILLKPETKEEACNPDEVCIHAWEAYRTDCYILGKYQEALLESDCFNAVTETLLSLLPTLPDPKAAVSFMEHMISRSPEYYEIDDGTAPILLYTGDSTCFSTLDHFALQLAESFRHLGQKVELFDLSLRGNQALTELIGKRFKAVIGIQSYVFHIMMQDGVTNLHDLIHGPKYQMVLDHPAWLKDSITQGPANYHLLIHDRYYMAFARQHYPSVHHIIHFPPGGSLPAHTDNAERIWQEKCYDISFIGTYRDYRERLSMLYQLQPEYRHLAAHFLRILRRQPDLPAEDALSIALSQNRTLEWLCQLSIQEEDVQGFSFPGQKDDRKRSFFPEQEDAVKKHSFPNSVHGTGSSNLKPAMANAFSPKNGCQPEEKETFLQLLYDLRQCCFCIMLYYREMIIQKLLNAGLTIHVYSDSWEKAPFAKHPGLIIHPSLSVSESLHVMQQSRISLNIMSWHKDGLTERILNSMLCQSVVLSDRSLALEERFTDGKELLLFSLKEPDRLPIILKELLQDEDRMKRIAMQGYHQACKEHLWSQRAKLLLENIECSIDNMEHS